MPVPEWGCSVIVRPLADGNADACGTYPIAVLAPGADVAGGLARLRAHGLVSVTLVLDDFHRPPLTILRDHFDVVKRFKTHHVRRRSPAFAYDKHHRYRIGRAYRSFTAGPLDLIEQSAQWAALYATLKSRHDLSRLHDFSTDHFNVLRTLPGVTAFGAWLGDELVSAQIWVGADNHFHGHLAASSEAGYREGAAYAAYDTSMTFLTDADIINFGGGAGLEEDRSDGLTVFKRGFANDVASSYIAGAILDPRHYHALAASQPENTDFFPRYRLPASLR